VGHGGETTPFTSDGAALLKSASGGDTGDAAGATGCGGDILGGDDGDWGDDGDDTRRRLILAIVRFLLFTLPRTPLPCRLNLLTQRTGEMGGPSFSFRENMKIEK
jgi:hypothetical protein